MLMQICISRFANFRTGFWKMIIVHNVMSQLHNQKAKQNNLEVWTVRIDTYTYKHNKSYRFSDDSTGMAVAKGNGTRIAKQ